MAPPTLPPKALPEVGRSESAGNPDSAALAPRMPQNRFGGRSVRSNYGTCDSSAS